MLTTLVDLDKNIGSKSVTSHLKDLSEDAHSSDESFFSTLPAPKLSPAILKKPVVVESEASCKSEESDNISYGKQPEEVNSNVSVQSFVRPQTFIRKHIQKKVPSQKSSLEPSLKFLDWI